MGNIVFTILVFLAAFLAIFSINLVLVDLFKRDRVAMKKRLEAELRERQRTEARQDAASKRDNGRFSAVAAALDAEEPQKSLLELINDFLEQSGSAMSLAQVALYSTGMAFVFGGVLGFLFQSWPIGLLAAAIAGALPVMYVMHLRKKRQSMMREQLPDALELMARVLRAGQTITQAMNSIADEFQAPLGPEFGYCYEQQNLGLSPEIALNDLAKRTGLIEMKIFVLSVLVHRQAGGNLAELLEKLSSVVRERFRIRGEIQALTAEGRMQASILLGLPLAVWVGLYFINREYAVKLLDHPSLVIGMIISMTVGALWIRKIVNFEF